MTPAGARAWCRTVILGAGGFRDFEAHEGGVISSDPRDVELALFVLRCLVNPDCKGSDTMRAALAVVAEPQEEPCACACHKEHGRAFDVHAAAPSLRPGGHEVYREALELLTMHGNLLVHALAKQALTAADAAAAALPTSSCPGVPVDQIERWQNFKQQDMHCPGCPRCPAAAAP